MDNSIWLQTSIFTEYLIYDMREIWAAISQFFKWIFIFPVKVYQWTLSPLLGANCRFHPTCSHYMVGAIQEWGPIKGIYLGVRRILKCHPWGPHGHDPVPKRKKV